MHMKLWLDFGITLAFRCMIYERPAQGWSRSRSSRMAAGLHQRLLDRIVHNAFRLELEGQSLRKTVAKMDDENPQT